MKKVILLIAVICIAVTLVFSVLYRSTGSFLSLLITSATFSYHFLFRLLVGLLFQTFMKNHADCDAFWFREKKWEPELYEKLNVRGWKNKMPTFNPGQFSLKNHSWNEIAQAMCQSELVHEVSAVLSFLPLAVCLAKGEAEDVPVFLITSLLAAALDICYAIMQRYNRPRILRLIKRMERRKMSND